MAPSQQQVLVPWDEAVKMIARESAQEVIREHQAACPAVRVFWVIVVAACTAAVGAAGVVMVAVGAIR